jgi:hypothetical protein
MGLSIVMGDPLYRWMVHKSWKIQSINGWWLGVAIWLRKPPYITIISPWFPNYITKKYTSCGWFWIPIILWNWWSYHKISHDNPIQPYDPMIFNYIRTRFALYPNHFDHEIPH